MNNSNIDQLGKKYNRWAIIIICAGAFLIVVFPALLSQLDWGFNFMTTGQIGDTIGGISAPIIGFMSAILIYFSFMIQYRANQMQWKAIRDEQLLARIDTVVEEITTIIKNDNLDRSGGINALINNMTKEIRESGTCRDAIVNMSDRFHNLNIYLEKITRSITQIQLSGLDEDSKEDIIISFLSLDIRFHEPIIKLDGHLKSYIDEIVRLEYELNKTEVLPYNFDQLAMRTKKYYDTIYPLKKEFNL